MMATPLPPPGFPQMANDGFINQAELDSDGGVIVVVNQYSDVQRGDYLTLNFDVIASFTLYIDNDDFETFFPWPNVIPADDVPDGTYQVWYTQLDAAGNTHASPVAIAVVDRQAKGTLPPPGFPEATDNEIDDAAAQSDGGTPVSVPAYTGITEGDTVEVYWSGFDSDGQSVPESITTVTHIVEATDLVGFSVLIATPYITSIQTGTAEAWYTVHPNEGLPERSLNASVDINTTQTLSLPPPQFTEGNDGWLDALEVSDGTPLLIPAYEGITGGDSVTYFWQGFLQNGTPVQSAFYTGGHQVTAQEASSGEGFSVTLPASAITPVGIGYGQSYYTVDFQSGDNGSSSVAQVAVDTQHTTLLPAPAFPEATSGTLDADAAESGGGTPMRVAYPAMVEGDIVTLAWSGYQNDDPTPVPGSMYSTTHTLTTNDLSVGYFDTLIPTSAITPVGNGYAIGQYQVAFISGGLAKSSTTRVNIMTTSTTSLFLNAATGAPYWADTSAPVRPVNSLTVSGPAGANVQIALSGDAYFNEVGENIWQGNLNQDGSMLLHVYSLSQGLISLTGYIIDDPDVSAVASMVFSDYTPGVSSLLGYAVTTDVAANGSSTASVYLKAVVSPDISFARVEISSGSARFVGYPFPFAEVNLYDDGTTTIDLTDLVAETVSLTLSLPEAAGSTLTTSTLFVTFPPAELTSSGAHHD
ncbi:hypothetical protein [Kluyvera intermedia]|uniref:hypothetical protein n=1 Tax=Kluyvera intermedia TaxID=61648 RepID=UPI00372CFED9